ncbi:hypothetical protein PHYSODRAFT_481964, partial [Phytophthora sojae]
PFITSRALYRSMEPSPRYFTLSTHTFMPGVRGTNSQVWFSSSELYSVPAAFFHCMNSSVSMASANVAGSSTTFADITMASECHFCITLFTKSFRASSSHDSISLAIRTKSLIHFGGLLRRPLLVVVERGSIRVIMQSLELSLPLFFTSTNPRFRLLTVPSILLASGRAAAFSFSSRLLWPVARSSCTLCCTARSTWCTA